MVKQIYNKFPITYNGNKYPHTRKNLNYNKFYSDFDKYDIIIEPFCGIIGFSRAYNEFFDCSKKKFIFYDLNDDLLNFHKKMKEGTIKECYDEIDNIIDENLCCKNKKTYIDRVKIPESKLILRGHLDFPTKCNYEKFKKCAKRTDFFELYKNFSFEKKNFMNIDFDKIIKENKNKKILVYLDPPYLMSNNKCYSYEDYDISEVYIYILELFKKYKKNKNINFILEINKTALSNFLYGKFEVSTYADVFQRTKRKLTMAVYFA